MQPEHRTPAPPSGIHHSNTPILHHSPQGKRTMRRLTTLLPILMLAVAPAALGQALPRITALYPPGARAGSTVEVAIRAGGLEGAKQLVVEGAGISAALNQAAVEIDPAEQKVFETKCKLCHQLRSPATFSRTPEQWAQTVDRMIKEKGAPIDAG